MRRRIENARVMASRISAMARPGRIALPGKVDVAALSKPEVYDRWNASVRAAETGGNVITMYDVIGRDHWSGGGVTLESVDAVLAALDGGDVEIHVNSPGGDMFEGIAIYNRLQDYPGQITVKVFGLAASAASLIAMAGDVIQMGPASFIMIHNCWVVAAGNRNDFRETAEFLEPFDAAMVGLYAARTGSDPAEIAAWMDAESYMGGDLAVQRGFADGLLGDEAVIVDEAAGASAMAGNALRRVELNLCRSMTRAQARDLIAKVKGTPGAAAHDAGTGNSPSPSHDAGTGNSPRPSKTATPGAGETPDWIAGARNLIQTLRG